MTEEIKGHHFKNPALLANALCHSSYANEHRAHHVKSNERLEYLGDAVLGMISAEYIFNTYTELPEGEMTKLRASIVCEQSLFEFAQEIGLGQYLLLGKGEINGGGNKRPSVLSDAVEAVLAAIYLDGGIEAAKDFILEFIICKADMIAKGHKLIDYKTSLQEIVQKNHQETLSYHLKAESGPDHNKTFVIEVHINSNPIAVGEGRSKKLAEQAAAKAALELMGQL
ncbi:MAG: ribonuclease III [Clostridia bacterium]|nr:ribonuclease III [Clostridia bacterium]